MQCTIVHLSERIKIQWDYSIGVLLSKAPDYISEQEYYPNDPLNVPGLTHSAHEQVQNREGNRGQRRP